MTRVCVTPQAVAKRAIEFRMANGLAFGDPCDIYELIAQCRVDLQFVDIPSLEGMYLEEPESERICVCAHRPAGRQHYTAAHELGHRVLGHGTQLDAIVTELAEAPSSSPEEADSDAFARYILMPPRAVQAAFRLRGFDLASLEPQEVYAAACWLGVGYVTLLNQMLYSLKILRPSDYERLSKVTPKSIKRKLAGIAPDGDVWPLDGLWANRQLHAQVGDLVVGIKCHCKTQLVTEIAKGLHAAAGVGQVTAPLAAGGNLTLNISRAAYVGFYEYRYLPE